MFSSGHYVGVVIVLGELMGFTVPSPKCHPGHPHILSGDILSVPVVISPCPREAKAELSSSSPQPCLAQSLALLI